MFDFEKITIDRLSKEEMLMILQALDYTYENKKIEQFLNLKESLVLELCSLTGASSQDELLEILTVNNQ